MYAEFSAGVTISGTLNEQSVQLVPHEGRPSVRSFLDSQGDASYTTMVTVSGGNALPHAEVHAARINVQVSAFSQMMTHVRQSPIKPMPELCIVAVRATDSQLCALCYAREGAPCTVGKGVMVDVHGAPRNEAQRKATRWSAERRGIEERRIKGAVETLLVQDGKIFEGTVTNAFFLRLDGALITAPDDVVLCGTLRGDVISVCREQGRKVILECPRVEHFHTYTAAFITNVVRGVQRVAVLSVNDVVHRYDDAEEVESIAKSVHVKVVENATIF